ncbi:MAG: hypothetical protein ABJA10_07770 [Aestuariivirga sp.]
MTWFALFVSIVRALAEALGIVAKQQERDAGAAISQNEANNAEDRRVANASDASRKLPDVKADPNNLDRE